MKVTEHIEQAKGKTLFSFEIIPPKKGQNIQELYNNIDPLMEFNPPFIDVTTSREEYVYIPKETLHRMENIGEELVEFVETQIGEYLGEEDIVRYQDDFGRV